MAPRTAAVKALAAGAFGAALLNHCAFVPAPAAQNRVPIAAAVGTAATLGASPAFADKIGDASAKLTDVVYPFFQDVDWNSPLYSVKPGSAGALEWVKAVDKAIVMGTFMDGNLLQAAAKAHHNAIGSIDSNGVLTKSALTEVDAAIGRLIASVPEEQTMGVYDAFKALVSPDVPPYLMSTVKEVDAKNAYSGLLNFVNVVKANPIEPAAYEAVNLKLNVEKLDAIEAAATNLAKGSYPFIKDVDWTSDLFTKPLPGVSAKEGLALVDKMIVMGSTMDPKLLKLAAQAHHKAIEGVDSKGVLKEADYEAITSALGKLIASVPKSKVMDVYNVFAKTVNPVIGNYAFDTFNKGSDAFGAYKALLEFKDVVKAAQVA